jgi:hypothetical protein
MNDDYILKKNENCIFLFSQFNSFILHLKNQKREQKFVEIYNN